MGYFTGDYLNFKERLHFWPTGISDLNQFIAEGTGYAPFLSTGDPNLLNYWNKEVIKKYEIFDQPSGTFSF